MVVVVVVMFHFHCHFIMYRYSNPLWTRALVTRWSASTKAAVRSGSLLAAQISQMSLALRSECARE